MGTITGGVLGGFSDSLLSYLLSGRLLKKQFFQHLIVFNQLIVKS